MPTAQENAVITRQAAEDGTLLTDAQLPGTASLGKAGKAAPEQGRRQVYEHVPKPCSHC